MTLAWRAVVLVTALLSIYLLFPILIVPSSLPAIQTAGPADATIFQLEIPQEPGLKNSFVRLSRRHRLGRFLIWQWLLTQTPLKPDRFQ